MNIDLSKQDYCNILNFYNIKFNKNLPIKIIRKITEKIIAEKLCRCIKKVPNENQHESRAIGICNYSVIQRKNLKIRGFTCKKKPKLQSNNKSKRLFKTTHNKIVLNKK